MIKNAQLYNLNKAEVSAKIVYWKLFLTFAILGCIPFLPVGDTDTAFIFIARAIVAVIGIPLFFALKKKFVVILLGCFSLSFLLPALIEGSLDLRYFLLYTYPIGFYSFIMYLAEKNLKLFLKALYYIACAIIIIHFALHITGRIFGEFWMLGTNRNGVQKYIIAASSWLLIYRQMNYDQLKRNKFIPVLLIICAVSLVLSGSATALMVLFIGVFTLIFHKRISVNFIYFCYAAFFFLIIILQVQNNILSKFLVDILGKDITFTHRTYRWDFALEIFSSSPIFGKNDILYELQNSVHFRSFLTLNPHNGLLEIMMYSGLIGVALLITIFVLFSKFVKKLDKKLKLPFLVFMAMFMVLNLMESDMNPATFMLFINFIVLYNCSRLKPLPKVARVIIANEKKKGTGNPKNGNTQGEI